MLELRIVVARRSLRPFDLPATLGRAAAAREIGETIDALIALMDDLDGDPDAEDDDPAGGSAEDVGETEDWPIGMPEYGVDQTLGPTNQAAAQRAHYERINGLSGRTLRAVR